MTRGAGTGRRAFTLIELMVAMVVAAIAATALYGIFNMQSRQFMMQDLQTEMHQNLRFAVDMVSRSVRMTGHNTSGQDIVGALGEAGPDDDLPVLISWDGGGPDGETDAITVVFGDADLILPTRGDAVEDCATNQLAFRSRRLDYGQRLAELRDGELLLCFDFADQSDWHTYLWALNGAADAVNGIVDVWDNTAYTDYSAACPAGTSLNPVMTCTKGHVMTFYVDNLDDGIGPGSPAHPVLMLDLNLSFPASDDVPLADDIEDLQFEYCVDPGGGVDCTIDTNWSTSVAAGDAANVWMVRIMMISRSPREEQTGQYQDYRHGLSNRSDSADWDSYYRTTMVTEVTLRNLRYQAALSL